MRIFLTGATGFVGHHVAKRSPPQGADLRLLVRKTSNLANLEGIAGDTVRRRSCAAPNPSAGARRLRRRRARRRRLSPLDSRSCSHVPRQRRRHARAAAHGPRSRRPARRLHLVRRHHALPHRRHRHQRRHAGLASTTWSATTSAPSFSPSRRPSQPRKSGQQVIILNPTTPIGPNDAKPTPTGRIFVDFLNRQISGLHGHRPQPRRRRRRSRARTSPR